MSGSTRSSASILSVGVAIGAMIGVGSVAIMPDERADLGAKANSAAVGLGLKRRREPQPGDHWSGCREARAAGTAAIYHGEPGYRSEMDGDDDGIACEPYRR